MQLKFLKMSPSGNVTVLVTFPYIASINTRQEVSKIIMERYNDVEQVGFISYLENNIPRLDMMGGEFCGNATRCLGALLVLDNPSVLKQIAPDCWHVEVSVSGVPSLLDVYLALNGNDINSSVRIAMKDVKYSEKMFNGFSLSVVSMEGITHVFVDKKLCDFPELNFKNVARDFREGLQLTSEDAVGIVWFDKISDKSFSIQPVVWVKNTNSVYYETACGSATAGLAWLFGKSGRIKDFDFLQPSGKIIKASFLKDGNACSVVIGGVVDILQRDTLDIERNI